jgi:hypothetical protein
MKPSETGFTAVMRSRISIRSPSTITISHSEPTVSKSPFLSVSDSKPGIHCPINDGCGKFSCIFRVVLSLSQAEKQRNEGSNSETDDFKPFHMAYALVFAFGQPAIVD